MPGNADSANSMGTLDLLKMGAKPVGTGWDVMGEYAGMYPELHYSDDKIPEPVCVAEPVMAEDRKDRDITETDAQWSLRTESLNEEQKTVIYAVESGVSRVDEIIEKSGLPAPKVLSSITILEIRGLIIRDLSGNIKLKKHF